MLRRAIAGLLLGGALSACAALNGSTTTSAAGADVPVQRYGEYGLDFTLMDKSVKPGDDFYRYTVGTWLGKTEIDPDRTYAGNDVYIDQTTKARLRAIVDDAASKKERSATEQKVGDFYASYMDEAAIEAAGLAPLQADLDAIAAIKDRKQLAEALGKLSYAGVSTPFGGYVDIDAKNPTRYLFRFYQDGLSLSDREYYLKTDAEFTGLREKFRAHVATILTMAGDADAEKEAQQVLTLETAIAKSHWPQEKIREDELTYNLWKRADLDKKAKGVDWNLVLGPSGLATQKEYLVSAPSALTGAAKLVAKAPLEQWKAYLRYHTIISFATYLPKKFDDERFAFYGKVISGQEKLQDRWKRGVDLLNGQVGEAVGQVYVAKYFPPEDKAASLEMIENFRTAFGNLIDRAEWMSPSTKKEARAKLASFNAKIGYPDKWRDYSKLSVARDDIVGNVRRGREFEADYQVAKLGQPIDTDEWLMVPQENNAYYWPQRNEIVFPAGILVAPYYDPKADLAVNYGSIGATVGHEMSHGFDDQGRKSDSKGVLRDWWTKEDAARYDAQSKKVVEQYNQFEPVKGLKLNGQQTLGENIADIAGLVIAYEAYKLALGGKEAPVIDGLTGDQRFFLAFAQSWRTKTREQTLRDRILSDVHSPAEQRVNGVVRNVDAWYEAFDVKPGDKLYLPPDERAKTW